MLYLYSRLLGACATVRQVRVSCMDDAGGRYTKQELSDVMWARLAPEFVNCNPQKAMKELS